MDKKTEKEELFFHKRKTVRNVLQKYIYKRNRTHYLKWVIDDEWSIRYFFIFETRSEYNHQWVLKSHYTKDYIIMDNLTAMDYIQHLVKDKNPIEYFSLQEFKKGYRRLVVGDGVECFLENECTPNLINKIN